MTEVALNWGFAPSAHRLADKIIGAPRRSQTARRRHDSFSPQWLPSSCPYTGSTGVAVLTMDRSRDATHKKV